MFKLSAIVYFLFCSLCYSDSVSVLFLGDTFFGSTQKSTFSYRTSPLYDSSLSYDRFFENVAGILFGSGAVICNLETPLTEKTRIISSRKPYIHTADPDSAVKYFNKYNIGYVNLGNNHVFDMGTAGFEQTTASLNRGNINFFGAGSNTEESIKPLILNKGGTRIIIFGGFEYRPNYDTLYHFYAGENSPGINMLDTIVLNERIIYYKNLYPGSKIIIFPHWGSNYGEVNERQINFAHSWINAGADAVIGHGSHTVQQIELYRNKYIFYGIGNFIFNAPGRYSAADAKPYGLMLKMIFPDTGTEFILYPVFTDNKITNYRLRLLNETEILDFEELYLKNKFKYSKSSMDSFTLNP